MEAASEATSDGLPTIPVFDLRVEPEDLEAVETVLRSGWLTAGPRTAELERAFADHLDVEHVLAVSSCTAALHLAYLAAGVGPGDEVIVPSYTFAATASAAVYCGARPVFADIRGLDDPTLDPDDVAARITDRTKAVCAVHFGGYAASIQDLVALCEERGLALVEDAAHAPATELDGRKLGTFGLAGAFSLFSNKVLAVGEGGFLATNDDDVAVRARRLRDHGMTSDSWSRYGARADGYDVLEAGFNYRLDDARSALGLSRLRRLPEEIARRRELTRRYRSLLRGIDGLRLPYRDEDVATSSAYVMSIFLDDPEQQAPLRERLLQRHGVQTTVLYPPVHEFTAYRERFPSPPLPRTERAGRTAVMLPLFGHMTLEQQDRVVDALRAALAA